MAAIDKPYRLNYYMRDGSVEIIDVSKGKIHLKRIQNDTLNE